MTWASGDTLDSATLNARMASGTTLGLGTPLDPLYWGSLGSDYDAALMINPSSHTMPNQWGIVLSVSGGTDSLHVVNTWLETYGTSADPNFASDGLRSFNYGNSGHSYYGVTSAYLYVTPGSGSTVEYVENLYISQLVSTGVIGTGQYGGADQIFIDAVSGTGTRNTAIRIMGVSGSPINNYGIQMGDVTGTGAFAISTGLGTARFGDTLASIRTIRSENNVTPASGTASGVKGDIVWDSGFVYVCTSTNSWSRATLNKF